ncbi:uncharacterized protein EV420DRAFT_410054 [Desarmillaria tabescens]|uniref:Uncharacterized protein n=1 Tax=Armillaria tabescens TaxID=1929756 RepID=A0AA39KDN9_ARMTA|nr:uncharacterized protein EV420DRAFT_410054 [Desarmillaria tabescens]KAK0458040.1 hypothetical protein EV420DRAFT_410054 [Desarmillaria tabescens]
MPLFTTNKNRLYVAYLVRHRKRPEDIKFHSCLLLSPKNSKDVTAEESYQYHSLNVIDPTSKKEIWKYVMQRVQNRPIRVQGVQLVGKLDKRLSGDTLDKILRQVTVVQDDSSWVCHNWVLDAVKYLVDRGLVEPFEEDFSIHKAWTAGFDFAEKAGYDAERLLPACDREGRKIVSEIGRLPC